MENTEYELLRKYMAFIKDVEGSDFLIYYPTHTSSILFTKEEIKILEQISEEVKNGQR